MIVWGALPVASAWAGPCPNEALRSELRSGQLPDCRAYEMVSPAYTESAVFTEVFAVSTEGSRVVAGSLGSFAGAEGGLLNRTTITSEPYLLSRTPAGWLPVSLSPSSSKYRGGGGMLDASADLDSSLWATETLAQPKESYDFYLERPLGTFVEIGPLAPGGGSVLGEHYFGASEDLSRVIFSTPPGRTRWSFDKTASGGTLYEYVGVEQPDETEEREPDLVGVEGGRGSTALIGRCGTRMGSSSTEEEPLGSVYNAISASGQRVFFTVIGADHDACGFPQPPVDELFIREEAPFPPPSTTAPEMRTLPLSCPPAPPSPCADANFEGASRDGSKAFFTSTGKLVEGASEDRASGSAQECSATIPGAGGCNLYEDELSSAGAQRLVLLSAGSADPEVQGVARISEDGSHVYFVAKGKLTAAPNALGHSALAGDDNLYVYTNGSVSFIAALAPGDAADWAHDDNRPVLASGEGRFLVFTSEADLTDEGIAAGKRQVFQYDAETGGLVRASIGEDGYNDDGREPLANSVLSRRFPSAYVSGTDSPTLAAGSQAPASGAVFFESPDALTPLALSDQRDLFGGLIPNVYEYRAGHVYLLSDGRDVSVVDGDPSVSLVGADPSGDDVFFFTSDPLISADGNTQQDLYDARVEGGFPAPPSPAECKEACQGPLAGEPPLPPPGGSATQPAEAQVAPATSAPSTVKPKAKKTVPRKSKSKKSRRPRAAKKARRVVLGGRAHRRSARSAR
jgi:hypothetical protein